MGRETGYNHAPGLTGYSMIEVQNLTKQYGPVTAIRDVSFSVAPGQIVGFLGPNGAGKTTTMRILACFMPATGGVARVAGYDVFRESMEVRQRIGYLPENVPLYSEMPVGAYLEFVAEVKGVGRSERKRRVAEVMERCLVNDVQHRLIGRLSKGYRQRVGLAQAIVSDPHVLILDEPTIGLDPKQIIEIRALIKSFAGEHTVILSTHILPEVSMVCSGVVIINKGTIVAQGPIDTLVEQFFPDLPGRGRDGRPAGGGTGGHAAHPRGGGRAGGRPRPTGAGITWSTPPGAATFAARSSRWPPSSAGSSGSSSGWA